MSFKLFLVFSTAILVSCSSNNPVNLVDEEADHIPEPSSWAFPGVIESARRLAPTNVEGKKFNNFGLVYSLNEYSMLDIASLPADELQKYADVVTHAYPDAVSRQFPEDCNDIPLKKVNGATVAGMAYISLHALRKNAREKSSICLATIKDRLRKT